MAATALSENGGGMQPEPVGAVPRGPEQPVTDAPVTSTAADTPETREHILRMVKLAFRSLLLR
ncbi:hypothetical protein ACX80D_10470 [Arthrobacter sp. Sr24]